MEDKKIIEIEEKLEESEEKYHSIFNSLLDVYYQVNQQHIITNLSPSCFAFSGWKPEELIGTDVVKIYADPEQQKTFVEKVYKNGVVYDYEAVLVHKTGRRIPVSVSGHIVKNKKGEIFLEGIIHDITEHKKVEDELNKSKEELKVKVAELEKLNGFMMDRELKIIELKNEVRELRNEVASLREITLKYNNKE